MALLVGSLSSWDFRLLGRYIWDFAVCMLEGHQAAELEAALKRLLPLGLGTQSTVGLNQLEDVSLANVCILKMSPRQGCSNGLRRFSSLLGWSD